MDLNHKMDPLVIRWKPGSGFDFQFDWGSGSERVEDIFLLSFQGSGSATLVIRQLFLPRYEHSEKFAIQVNYICSSTKISFFACLIDKKDVMNREGNRFFRIRKIPSAHLSSTYLLLTFWFDLTLYISKVKYCIFFNHFFAKE